MSSPRACPGKTSTDSYTISEEKYKEPKNYPIVIGYTTLEEAEEDVADLTMRLEEAEEQLLLAASIIMHLSGMKDIGEKIESMKPYRTEYEGEDTRQQLWHMGKRIAALELVQRRHSKGSSSYRDRLSKDARRTDMENLNKYPIGKSAEEKEEPTKSESPSTDHPNSATSLVLRTDITMREVAKVFRDQINNAREKFQEAHKISYLFSKRFLRTRESFVPLDSLCQCANEVESMKSALNALTGGQFESDGDVDFVHNKRLKKSENLLSRFDKRINKIGNVKARLDKFITREKDMDINLQILFNRLDSGVPLRSGLLDNASHIQKLFKMIHQVEQDVKKVSEVPNKLKDSEIQRDAAVDAIEESVELLSIIKLDKADLEDALNEKVDKIELDQKVPRTYLKNTQNNLSNIIENNEELFWRRDAARDRTKGAIISMLQSKVDANDFAKLERLKEKVLRQLEERIHKIPKAQSQIETAGTKKPLGNVCCRCKRRKTIVFRRLVPGGMTPYHAYELHAIDRKQRKMFLQTRDNDEAKAQFVQSWEQALRSLDPKHRNRFHNHRMVRRCGGIHTTTTPEQRVTRLVPFDAYKPCPLCQEESTK